MSVFPTDIICFSHIRWGLENQRPQQLLRLFAETFNVYYVEGPVFDAEGDAFISFSKRAGKLWVGVPHLPGGLPRAEINGLLDDLVDKFLTGKDLSRFLFWYYNPTAIAFTEYFHPRLRVYDCANAGTGMLPEYEQKLDEVKLVNRADLIFAADTQIFNAKTRQNKNTHLLPNSQSWESTHQKMIELISATLKNKEIVAA